MTDKKPYRTMRLALAMRGGVSLAVWIGGAVAELDLFRRACNGYEIGPDPNGHRAKRAETYRALLAGTERFDRVEIDILAGASAGGLNAVLFGLAQACDTVMDDTVRRTWIEEGGIWKLLREPGFGRVESILRGDGRLFEVVRKALGAIAGSLDPSAEAPPTDQPLAKDGSPAPRITVELAATLLDDPRYPERQNRARFSFSKTGGSLHSGYSTIPTCADRVLDEDTEGRENSKAAGTARWRRQMALDRLALAARATSSFPGAFEPARIYSMRSGSASPGKSAPLPSDYATTEQVTVNMARAFLYSAGRTEPFGVVDGGIFDNIPIDRAIQAIQRASASEPSDRSLVYLDPEPPVSRGLAIDAPAKTSAASWVPVIRSSLSLKQRQETASDELSLVREYNDRVLQTRGRLEALAAIMRALRQSAGSAENNTTSFVTELVRDDSYTQCRIAMDAPRIAALLTEPWTELCYPPREAVDYVPLPHKAAIDIKNQVALAYNDTSVDWKLSTDVVALLDWVRVLIAWVRALEDLLVDYTPDDTETDSLPADLVNDDTRGALLSDLMRWKAALYRWLTVLGEAKHRAVDEVLARPLRSENRTPDEQYPLIASMQESRGAQMSLTLTPELRSLLLDPVGAPDQVDADMYRLLSTPTQFRYPSGESLVATVQAGLDTLLGRIRTSSREVVVGLYDPLNDPRPPAQTPVWLARWAESVYPHFYLPPLATYDIEQIAKIFASTGVPDTAHVIRFDTITGDERPRIGVSDLEKAAKAKYLGQWLRKAPGEARMVEVIKDTDGLLTADAKLAGNALNRFGGFFLWHWRENDWQWGRLDSAAGIVRLLANRSKFSDGPPAEGVGQLQAAVDTEVELRRRFIEDRTKTLQEDILAESAEQQTQFLVRPSGRRGATPSPPPLVTTVGGESLSAVSPRYRFALASRIVPLVYRALWPGNSSPFSVGGALSRLGNVAIRPVAVVVPLVADPLRLTVAVIIALATAGALGASVTNGLVHGISAVAMSVLGLLIAARTWRLGRSWRTLTRKLDSVGDQYPQLKVDEWSSLLRDADSGRWRIASWVLVVCCLGLATVFGMAARHAPIDTFVATESILAIVAVILGVQHWLNQRALRIIESTSAVPAKDRVAMWTVTLAVGVAVAVVPLFVHVLTSPACNAPPWNLLAAGAGTAALTAVSLWGWTEEKGAAAAIVVSGLAGAGVQFVLDAITDGNPLCDLAPLAVWLVAVSVVSQRLPHRTSRYGQPPMQKSAASAASAGTSADNVVSLTNDNAA